MWLAEVLELWFYKTNGEENSHHFSSKEIMYYTKKYLPESECFGFQNSTKTNKKARVQSIQTIKVNS